MAIGERLLDQLRFHELDVANEANIDRLALVISTEVLLAKIDVVARHAERVSTARLEGFANLSVDLVVEGFFDDLDRRGVGNAHTASELGFNTGLIHSPGDGLTAAVNDDDLDADGGQEGDIRGDAVAAFGIRIIHEAAAVLNHEGGATELVDVGKCLEKDLGFLRGRNAHLTEGSVGIADG